MRHATSGRRSRTLAALCALACGSLIAGEAAAYCRSSTCQPDPELGIQGAICDPPLETDCGAPLRWERDCIGFTLQQDASREISLKTARKILSRAFDTWESVDCGGAGPGIHVIDMGTVECDRVEYEPRAGNANIVIFRDDDWEENGYDKLALTTVNYDKETGEIWNADIEINTREYDFIQGEDGGDWDLDAVLTHEAGHFLGLAHSSDPQATMFASYHEGMPDLLEDDIIGICSIYPPKKFDRDTCNPIPRHGFSPRCAAAQTEGRCSISGLEHHSTPGGAPLLAAAAAIGMLALRRKKRFRKTRRRKSPPPGSGAFLLQRIEEVKRKHGGGVDDFEPGRADIRPFNPFE